MQSITRAGLSAVPVLGGLIPLAFELVSVVITPQLEQRRTAWLNGLDARLSDCEQKIDGFSVSSLVDSPEFITAVTNASQIAIRNHNEEKIAALRNAVVNVALGEEIDNELYLLFLSLVDSLTPLHLRILTLCRDAYERSQRFYESELFVDMHMIIEQAVPEITQIGDPLHVQEVLGQIGRDLYNNGLIRNDQIHIRFSPESPAHKHTTDYGDRFLRFISEHDPAR